MIPFATAEEAEAALGRSMTWVEAAWFRYSGSTPDHVLCFLNFFILFACYTLAAVPIALLELYAPRKLTTTYKLQPKVQLTPDVFLRCYKDTARILALVTIGPLLLVPYPALKVAGIRTGLPLPSAWEVVAQLLMYMLMEDYLGYWFHRLQHTAWFYNNIHYVHHEFKAPMGFVAAYAHWSESLIVGFASFVGMIIVPCHMTTCWLWFAIRGVVGVDIHCGFRFPFSPTKFIPFYGGAEFHDYHHYGGKWSQNNFAPLFTFCDYIYGTDKGYRHHKARIVERKDVVNITFDKEGFDGTRSQKQD